MQRAVRAATKSGGGARSTWLLSASPVVHLLWFACCKPGAACAQSCPRVCWGLAHQWPLVGQPPAPNTVVFLTGMRCTWCMRACWLSARRPACLALSTCCCCRPARLHFASNGPAAVHFDGVPAVAHLGSMRMRAASRRGCPNQALSWAHACTHAARMQPSAVLHARFIVSTQFNLSCGGGIGNSLVRVRLEVALLQPCACRAPC
jgi:hypothetical protein